MQNPPSLCKFAKPKMRRIQRDKIPRAIFRIIDAICASRERPGLTGDITAFQPSRAYPESFTPAGKGTGWAVAGVPLEGGGGEVTREGYSRTLPKTLKYWQPDGQGWTHDAGRGGVGKERLPHLRALSRKPSVKDPHPHPRQVPRPVAGDRCCGEMARCSLSPCLGESLCLALPLVSSALVRSMRETSPRCRHRKVLT